jgi:hypothetical protein
VAIDMFRRRLPQMGGTSGASGGSDSEDSSPDTTLEQQYREKFGRYADLVDFSKVRNQMYMEMMTQEIGHRMEADKGKGQSETLAGPQSSSGGSGTTIIVVGLIVALFLFQ